jgi:hypothetical protein
MDTVKLPADFIRHDLVGQALLSVVSEKYQNSNFEAWMARNNFPQPGEPDVLLEVAIVINGESFPFHNLMTHWQNQIDEMVDRRARKILELKHSELEDRMAQVARAIDLAFPETNDY